MKKKHNLSGPNHHRTPSSKRLSCTPLGQSPWTPAASPPPHQFQQCDSEIANIFEVLNYAKMEFVLT